MSDIFTCPKETANQCGGKISFLEESIGFGKGSQITYIVISILGLLVNCLFLSFLICKFLRGKKTKISSLEQILFIITCVEIGISLMWMTHSIWFFTLKEMHTKCCSCQKIAIALIFLYIFDWTLISFSISQFKIIMLNPIISIFKPKCSIISSILLCLCFALLCSIFSSMLQLNGMSPMLTCFFYANVTREEDSSLIKMSRIFILVIFFSIPLINLIYGAKEGYLIYKNLKEQRDEEMKQLFIKYFSYIGTYILLTFLLFTLYVVDFFVYDEKGAYIKDSKPFHWYSYIITLLSLCTPFIVGILRLFQLKWRKRYLNIFGNKKNKKENLLENLNSQIVSFEDPKTLRISILEMKSIEKFVYDILISVCFCLEKNNTNYIKNIKELKNNLCIESKEYFITKSLIQKENESQLKEDNFIKKRDYFVINCVEFAPKIFSYLRDNDKVDTYNMVTSLLPMNNTNGIKASQGRSGNLFLISDDNQYILKTISYEDAELIRRILLEKMSIYFTKNQNSLIGRIYGLYKLKLKTGMLVNEELYFILMKHVYGTFNENFICKYDLKGSTLDRKVTLNESNIEKGVLKDVNFMELEGGLLIRKEDSEKLLDICIDDATFLADLGIMDYSLLVVKLSLNKDEVCALFGMEYKKETENEYRKMLNELCNKNEPIDKEVIEEGEYNELNLRFRLNNINQIKKYIFPSLKVDIMYIVAIIDFFQVYNIKKSFETKFKSLRSGKLEISSVPPNDYLKRFINNIRKISNIEQLIKDIHGSNSQSWEVIMKNQVNN